LSPLVPGQLPLEQLFERPTVAGLAELVLAAQAEQESGPGLTRLLDQIEGMTEEEADASLAAAHAVFARDDAAARP
jgi:hypothetical protein